MKTIDCPECRNWILHWESYRDSKYPRVRALVKYRLRELRRKHMKMRRHDFPWKSYGSTYVSGCYKKTLIHNGRK